MNLKKSKQGQEEIVGFALIIVIVAVILLIFLAYTLKNPKTEAVGSHEIEGFISSALQHRTDCSNNQGPLSIRELVFDCDSEDNCLDGRSTCEVLNSTLTEILKESWRVGEDMPMKGYQLKILRNSAVSMIISNGNITESYKAHVQDLGKDSTEVFFTAYY